MFKSGQTSYKRCLYKIKINVRRYNFKNIYHEKEYRKGDLQKIVLCTKRCKTSREFI